MWGMWGVWGIATEREQVGTSDKELGLLIYRK